MGLVQRSSCCPCNLKPKQPLQDQQRRGQLQQSAEYRVSRVTVPLPCLPLDSDSMVVAEIAGRSMPDEDPRLPPQYLIPYACCMNVIRWYIWLCMCYVCDVHSTCDVCFAGCLCNSSIGEVVSFINLQLGE